MTLVNVVTILFLGTLIFLCISLARKLGGLEQEKKTQQDLEEVDKLRDEIASRPTDSADKLLERMRSPHADH